MPQPDPIPNDSLDIQTLVIRDLRDRRELGIRTYGTPLQAHNGRDALVDAYEEALDLCCYLRQAIAERGVQVRLEGVQGPASMKVTAEGSNAWVWGNDDLL